MYKLFLDFIVNPSKVWSGLEDSTRHKILFYVIIMTIISCGFSIVPPGHIKKYVSFAADPLNSDLFITYNGDAPLHYLLAHAVGASTIVRYLTMCIFFVLLTYVSIYIFSSRNKELKSDPTLILLIFCAHPISYILTTWIGLYDGITVLCTSILLFIDSPIVISAIACLGFTNHPSIAFISLSLIILRYLTDTGRININHIGAVVIGLIAGQILLMVLHHYIGIHAETRLSIVNDFQLKEWVKLNLAYLPLVLYSFNFALWIPVMLMLLLFYNNNLLLYNTYLFSMFIFYVITSFTYDTTRVFAILSWAPTLHCLIYTWKLASSDQPRDIMYRNSIIYSASLGWIFPHLYLWDGIIHSPWLKDIYNIIITRI